MDYDGAEKDVALGDVLRVGRRKVAVISDPFIDEKDGIWKVWALREGCPKKRALMCWVVAKLKRDGEKAGGVTDSALEAARIQRPGRASREG